MSISKEESDLFKLLLDKDIIDDPYAWCKVAFPWGKEGTPLKGKLIREWQAKVLKRIARFLHKKKMQGISLTPDQESKAILKIAKASGRGIGKSALIGMIGVWFFSTRIGSSTIIAANGKAQLTSYTMPEFNKWILLAANAHWFDTTI